MTLVLPLRRPAVATAGAFPSELLNIGGVIGEMVKLIVDTAARSQPVLALGAALCCVGTLAGRKYRSRTNLRSNIYALGVADSGGGKDHARVCIKEVLPAAGLDRYLGGEEIASGPGLLTSLKIHPCRLYLLDEIGKFLSTNNSKYSPSYKQEIMTNLTKLYSSAGGVMRGTEYADQQQRPRVDIQQPCCSVYATTVPGTFWAALSSGAFSDGSMARFLLFLTDEDYPDSQEDACFDLNNVPLDLIAGLQAIAAGPEWEGRGNLEMLYDALCTPYVVPETTEAKVLLHTIGCNETEWLREKRGTNETAAIARFRENVIKVALILSISDNPAAPIITVEHVEWAEKLVRHCIKIMLQQAEVHVSDNEIQANHKWILEIIRKAGFGGIGGRDLARKTQKLKPRERTEILDVLAQAEQIIATKIPITEKGGRQAFNYRSVTLN